MTYHEEMKKITIYGSLLIGCLVCIELYWFSKAFNTSDKQFDHTVSIALHTVADSMSESASVKKMSSNFYFVTTNCPVSERRIDSLIQREFKLRNLLLEYEIGVYNADDDTLVYGNYIKSTNNKNVEFSHLMALDGIDKNFGVHFPGKESYIVAQLDIWLFSTVVLILVALFFYYTLRSLKKSNAGFKTRSNQIRLGNTLLDIHNQFLKVNGLTFQLTYKENKILTLFFENPNQVIEREVFLENIWERDGFFAARSMDVFISKIRKYLSVDTSIKIENLRSIGYRLHVR